MCLLPSPETGDSNEKWVHFLLSSSFHLLVAFKLRAKVVHHEAVNLGRTMEMMSLSVFLLAIQERLFSKPFSKSTEIGPRRALPLSSTSYTSFLSELVCFLMPQPPLMVLSQGGRWLWYLSLLELFTCLKNTLSLPAGSPLVHGQVALKASPPLLTHLCSGLPSIIPHHWAF